MFLNKQILRHTYETNAKLETAVVQEMVDEGRRELDAKRSMVRHVSHEIRYGSTKSMQSICSGSDRRNLVRQCLCRGEGVLPGLWRYGGRTLLVRLLPVCCLFDFSPSNILLCLFWVDLYRVRSPERR